MPLLALGQISTGIFRVLNSNVLNSAWNGEPCPGLVTFLLPRVLSRLAMATLGFLVSES